MAGFPAKAVFPAVRAALRNQRAHSAKFISIVSGFDDNLGILLAPVRVKGAQHFVGLVEVLESARARSRGRELRKLSEWI